MFRASHPSRAITRLVIRRHSHTLPTFLIYTHTFSSKGKAEKRDDQPTVLAFVNGHQPANTTLKVEEGEVSQSGQTEVRKEAFI